MFNRKWTEMINAVIVLPAMIAAVEMSDTREETEDRLRDLERATAIAADAMEQAIRAARQTILEMGD